MKKVQLPIAVLSLSALAFVSCKKDDKSGSAGDMMSFTASIGGGAKTEIDGLNMKWTGGEEIRINGMEFFGEKEGDGTTAVFTGETVDSPYEAYFLADYTQKDGKYVLPATQTYNGNNLSKVNPMYAKSETTDLQFHSICAMLELKVKGEGIVKEIAVTTADGKLLSGAFKVSTTGGKYFAEVLSDGSSIVTLNCGEGVELKAEKDTTFYIALPQGNYENLKFELKGGKVWDTTLSVALHAGKIRTKELAGINVVKPVPTGAISGEFTVGMDGATPRTVYFSKGNLYYDGTNSKWEFESNQWDTNPTADDPTGSYGTYSSSHVSHFLWSPDKDIAVSTSESVSGDASDVFFTNSPSDAAKPNKNFHVNGETGDNQWRTLTSAEWVWLLGPKDYPTPGTNCRTSSTIGGTSNARYAEVKVNGVCGIMLFPDEFTWPSDVTTVPTTFNAGDPMWNRVNYTTDFEKLESAGAVFLPASGYRSGTIVSVVGSSGYYWPSTPNGSDAYNLRFEAGTVDPQYNDPRTRGSSVRLVQEVK